MKKTKVLFLLAALVSLAVWGCSKTPEESAVASDVVLCGGCGQIKGSELCCDADAEKCDGCSLAKGSPGCCTIEKGRRDALRLVRPGQGHDGMLCRGSREVPEVRPGQRLPRLLQDQGLV